MDPTGTCRQVGQGCSAGLASRHCAGLVFFLPIFVQILSFLLFWPSLPMEKDVPLYVAEKEERPWSWGWSTPGRGERNVVINL